MQKIAMSRQELLAALLFASTDGSRFTITGVLVEVAKGAGKPVIVATDGRRLCAINTLAEQPDLLEPSSFILRPEIAALFAQVCKVIGGKNNPWLTIEPRETAVIMRIIGVPSFELRLDGALIDGVFPEWRKVVPDKHQRRAAVKEVGLNAALVGDFAKAGKHLDAESSVVQMNLVGKEGQIEVHLAGIEYFYGLIMPCRIDQELDYQPEFLAIAEMFPQPEDVKGE